MIPGVNPRQLKQMMKQMGISQDELEVSQLIMKTSKGTLVFDNPSVTKVIMQGQTSFQVTGEYREEEETFETTISEEDVGVVAEQAGVSKDEARRALEKSQGDIAQAIVSLTE